MNVCGSGVWGDSLGGMLAIGALPGRTRHNWTGLQLNCATGTVRHEYVVWQPPRELYAPRRSANRGAWHLTRANGPDVGLDYEIRQKYLNRKADCNIEPFLRMLRVHDLIECDANPRKATTKTRIKIQKFVYFAQKCFGLEFRYRHTLYIYGPYSLALATDYFRIKDIANIPDGGLDDWNRRDEFLEFAKKHNDETWLEIGGTLVHLYKSGHKSMEDLIKYAHVVKRKYPKELIESVCSDLQGAELIKL